MTNVIKNIEFNYFFNINYIYLFKTIMQACDDQNKGNELFNFNSDIIL